MRAMILAAGRGARLRPLTDTLPKPLIEVGGKPLIAHHLEKLAAAGFREVVINTGHLGAMLPQALGSGSDWGLIIHYSEEPETALETGGGIFQALPLLGAAPFAVISGDVWTDFPLDRLRHVKCDWAHLVMVPNPPHHPDGDLALNHGRLRSEGPNRCTFSGLAVYHPRFFDGAEAGRWRITQRLMDTADQQLVTGELYTGGWHDSGTAERLAALRAALDVED
ncbi:MAG: nucleotidyltransferase family protein [Xanthomonadales bacterium]|nr:nucleotidyltransferase family protein [Xanthomonadales bacterium]